MKNVLFLNHPDKQCGVHQFGRYIAEGLRDSKRYSFLYNEIVTMDDVDSLIEAHDPAAIIFNWHSHVTMPNIDLQQLSTHWIPLIGIMHEISDDNSDHVFQVNHNFDAFIIHELNLKVNRSNKKILRTVRPLLKHSSNTQSSNSTVRKIGSIGFATPNKDYPGIVSYVQSQLDNCVIRFNIPSAKFGDSDGANARAVAQQCRDLIVKPGIELQISHDFLTQEQLLDFLSENSVNIFFYRHSFSRGISSAVDLAIASGRPIALNRDPMFRHLFDVRPSIFVEDNSLTKIIDNGTSPLDFARHTWTLSRVLSDYENFIDSIVGK